MRLNAQALLAHACRSPRICINVKYLVKLINNGGGGGGGGGRRRKRIRVVALNKNKKRSPDVRPIVVEESLRRLAGKCICATLKEI